jgi:hypothetical protein
MPRAVGCSAIMRSRRGRAGPVAANGKSHMTVAGRDAPIGAGSRIDIADRADFHPGIAGMKAVQMFRISYVFLFALAAQVFATSSVSAQQGHDACARDVSRFCRALTNDGDSVVLGCLKQHRARLSRACDKVLTENGQ